MAVADIADTAAVAERAVHTASAVVAARARQAGQAPRRIGRRWDCIPHRTRQADSQRLALDNSPVLAAALAGSHRLTRPRLADPPDCDSDSDSGCDADSDSDSHSALGAMQTSGGEWSKCSGTSKVAKPAADAIAGDEPGATFAALDGLGERQLAADEAACVNSTHMSKCDRSRCMEATNSAQRSDLRDSLVAERIVEAAEHAGPHCAILPNVFQVTAIRALSSGPQQRSEHVRTDEKG